MAYLSHMWLVYYFAFILQPWVKEFTGVCVKVCVLGGRSWVWRNSLCRQLLGDVAEASGRPSDGRRGAELVRGRQESHRHRRRRYGRRLYCYVTQTGTNTHTRRQYTVRPMIGLSMTINWLHYHTHTHAHAHAHTHTHTHIQTHTHRDWLSDDTVWCLTGCRAETRDWIVSA